jgi:hypothetical protein
MKQWKKIRESIESFEEEYEKDHEIYNSPISIHELHKFLKMEEISVSEEYALRA